ncbi:MAG: hypothetical protein QW272_08140 [Candidatus Methanomethylicaceae archaeon]
MDIDEIFHPKKYIVKFGENSVFFKDSDEAKYFFKDILRKYDKVEIRMEEEYKTSEIEEATNILKILKEELDVPNNIFEKSIEICKEIFNKKLHKGKGKGKEAKIISITSLYISYKIFNEKIKISKIIGAYPSYSYREDYFERTKALREIIKFYNFLIKKLDLKIPLIEKDKFIKNIVLKLNLSKAFKRIDEPLVNDAKDILKSVKYKIEEKDPILLASSSVFLAIRNYLLEKISDDIGIPIEELVNNIKEMDKILKEEKFYKKYYTEEIEEKKKEEHERLFSFYDIITIIIVFIIAFILLHALNNFIIELIKKLPFHIK